MRPYFPRLPSRPQFNRLVRAQQAALTAFALWLAARLDAAAALYEVLDGTAVPTRNAKRRGRGWLAGPTDIGKCLRRGWIHGLRLLVCTAADGIVTGWGVGPASTNDRALAETLFAARTVPQPRLPSVGTPARSVYVADAGFAGQECEAHWGATYQAQLVAPPLARAAPTWTARDQRWLAGRRQVVERVIARLQQPFRLDAERPHRLDGFLARLAAKMGLHNVCLWLNRQHGHPDLALAHLFGW
ncbi:MAG: transposase [Chloroflexota bacterium]|nr:transposase [Chloroflexota bacterium]